MPVETYTTADGLGNNVVNRIVHDSRGFVWFATREGLSRFDGYDFTTYDVQHGLPSAVINDFLETREGVYWVATRGGLARFNPLGDAGGTAASVATPSAPMFTAYTPDADPRAAHVTSVLQDRSGVVWVGTWGGLYRLDNDVAGQPRLVYVDLGIADRLEARIVRALAEDSSGALWVGAASGLYRRLRSGQVERYTTTEGLPIDVVHSLLLDRDGRMWVGTRYGGLIRLTLDAISNRPNGIRVYGLEDGLPTTWINKIFQASDGGLWAGSIAGVLRFQPAADGTDTRFQVYSVPQGLPHQEVTDVAEDRSGSLWVATVTGGVARLSTGGFTVFDVADGLQSTSSLIEMNRGELVAVGTASTGEWSLHRFADESFDHVEIPAMHGIAGWGWNQTALVDRAGDWWVASGDGVLRFPAVDNLEELARVPYKALYSMRDGLAANVVLRLFEDSRGDIWIGTAGHGARPNGLSRWERQTATLRHYSEKNGLPSLGVYYVSALVEDHAGNVWVGFSGDGGLVRYRNERFERAAVAKSASLGPIRNLLVDSRGRLWAAGYHGGLGRCDDPDAENPELTRYTTADGLSSNEVQAVVEDRLGRIYAGTARGIDRLDPVTGRVRRVLPPGRPIGEYRAALRDRHGALWFSSSTGLLRLIPQPTSRMLPSQPLITSVRIAGRDLAVSALGQTKVGPLELPRHHNQVQVNFVALGAGPGEVSGYQVWLEGADQGWSAPLTTRSVNYASLSPGAYRFLVRAVNADGNASDAVASLAFTILPPIWLRWWFVSLATLAVAAVATSVYRYHVARLLEMANLRTRIATDLHDDIGANLTRIAVVSEVVRQQSIASGSSADRRLASIASLARESVSSLSDIVWAINPERDRVQDLTSRMREHAEDLFANANVALRFDIAAATEDRRVDVGIRRDLFLIFKEAIHNAARHSGCSQVDVAVHTEESSLSLLVHDDGVGFNPRAANGGNGLINMRRRADRLGAKLELVSTASEGTTMRLRVVIHPTSRSR